MTERLEIAEAGTDGTRLLIVRGELDIAAAPRLQARLLDLLAERLSVDLDLGELSFIDSTGLAVLIRATEVAERDGGAFSIVAASRDVMRVVELAGLAERLHLGSERGDPWGQPSG